MTYGICDKFSMRPWGRYSEPSALLAEDQTSRRSSVAEVTVKYTETGIDGVTVVDIEPHNHERGLFARSFCADEFAKNGLDSTVAQVNFAYTPRARHAARTALAGAAIRRSRTGAMYARCHLCCGRRHPAGIRYLQ